MKADRPIRSGAESLFSVLRLYDASVDCWGVTDMIWNTRGKHLPRSNLGVARCWRESATDSPGQRVDGSRRVFSSYNFRVNWIYWKKWKFLTWSVINTLTGSYYSELAQPPWLAGFLAQVCCFRPLESTLLWDLKTVTQEKTSSNVILDLRWQICVGSGLGHLAWELTCVFCIAWPLPSCC